MDSPTPTTEIEAVNLMLATIGESPVNSLAGPANADVAIARNLLKNVSKEVQREGWAFNTESDYSIAPDGDGNIIVPTNCIRIDADTDSSVDVVYRAGKLYDRKNHTFTISKTLKVEIIWMFPFDELPETIRQYITIRAARKFQGDVVGSVELAKFSQMDEMMARSSALQEEGDTGDYNILNGPDQAYISRRWMHRRYGN